MSNDYLKSEALDYDYITQMKTYFGTEEKKKTFIKNMLLIKYQQQNITFLHLFQKV